METQQMFKDATNYNEQDIRVKRTPHRIID